MKAFKTVEEAKQALSKVTSGVASTDIFIAKCFPLLLELLIKQTKRKSKRKPTEWNLFAGEAIRDGKTVKEAAKLYKEQKK